MSASTACNASRLLWMSLMIAFTLASCGDRRPQRLGARFHPLGPGGGPSSAGKRAHPPSSGASQTPSSERPLSGGAWALGFAVGLLVWRTGWWQLRFWIVVSLTAVAGIYGLQSGRASGVQPVVAGLLAARGAGFLGLELARLLAFAGGGAVASF